MTKTYHVCPGVAIEQARGDDEWNGAEKCSEIVSLAED